MKKKLLLLTLSALLLVSAVFPIMAKAVTIPTQMQIDSIVETGSVIRQVEVNESSGKIYCRSMDNNKIMVLDAATKQKLTEIDVYYPTDMQVDETSNKIYVCGWSEVLVIDGNTDTVEKRFPQGCNYSIAVNAAANKIYLGGNGQIWVMDLSDGSILKTISLPRSCGINPKITIDNLEIDLTYNHIYGSGGWNSATLYLIDGATDECVQKVAVAFISDQLAVNQNTHYVYSVHDFSWYVSCLVVNEDSGLQLSYRSAVSSSPIAYPLRVAVDESDNSLYMAGNDRNGGGIVAYVPSGSLIPTERLAGLSGYITGIALNKARNEIYVSNYNGQIFVITRKPIVGQTITNLVSDVTTQLTAISAPPGTINSLNVKLQDALALYNAGDTATAITRLNAFINETQAQRGKKIPTALADEWISLAQALIAAIQAQ